MNANVAQSRLSFAEFVIIISLMTSLTVLPLIVGIALLSGLSILVVRWAESS